jgi:hypothetical protein
MCVGTSGGTATGPAAAITSSFTAAGTGGGIPTKQSPLVLLDGHPVAHEDYHVLGDRSSPSAAPGFDEQQEESAPERGGARGSPPPAETRECGSQLPPGRPASSMLNIQYSKY